MSDHHAKPFDEATQTKLFIYKSYVQAWIQVFLHTEHFADRPLRFFDFFAGPGCDQNGVKGSPAILLDELQANRELIEAKGRKVEIYFNDSKKAKVAELRKMCAQYQLPWQPKIEQKDFREAFEDNRALIGDGPSLLFLDQCGVKYVDRPTFEALAGIPRTDVLFFFASSFQRRFNDEFSNDLNIPKDIPHVEVHRRVADHYRQWAPAEYFIGDYSLRKGSNIYGLVFGSGHWLGMLKFLEIVWRGELGGDANFEMEAGKMQGDLFGGFQLTKLEILEREIREGIVSGRFATDAEVALHCITKGVLPSRVASSIYRQMKTEGILDCRPGEGPRTTDQAIRHPRKLEVLTHGRKVSN